MTLEHNVIVFNTDHNFNVGNQQGGTGHTFRDNCTYMANGTSGINGGAGVAITGNVTADPLLDANPYLTKGYKG